MNLILLVNASIGVYLVPLASIDFVGLVCQTLIHQTSIWLCGVMVKALGCKSAGGKFESRSRQVSTMFQYFYEMISKSNMIHE